MYNHFAKLVQAQPNLPLARPATLTLHGTQSTMTQSGCVPQSARKQCTGTDHELLGRQHSPAATNKTELGPPQSRVRHMLMLFQLSNAV